MTDDATQTQNESNAAAQPAEGSDEHRAALRKAGEKAAAEHQTPDNTDGSLSPGSKERPEGVPEKFWDAEKGEIRTDALVKSYTELEKMRGKQPESLADDADVNAVLAKAKLDPNSIGQQFADKGELTAEQYEAIRKVVPVPRAMIDTYLQMQTDAIKAQGERLQSEAAQEVGGGEQLESMLKWARDGGMDESDIDLYEQLIDAGKAKSAARYLKSKYTEAAGASGDDGQFDNTSPTAGKGIQPFSTHEEMSAAMLDDRYAPDNDGMPNPDYDPAYRRHVLARLQKTNL